jgi:outer membrane protein assembly factor BamB
MMFVGWNKASAATAAARSGLLRATGHCCVGLLLARIAVVSMWAVMVAASVSSVAGAEEWPQWRGPRGNGITREQGAPTEWSAEGQKGVAWRTPLAEPGNSTPIVWGDQVFVAQPDRAGKQRKLLCFSRIDGKLLWEQGVPYEGEEPTHETNPFCSASPVTDGERVIVWYGSAGLVAYDMQGQELWRRDLGEQRHKWGYGSSPILVGDLCILSFGPGVNEFLLAVDKKSGETRWKLDAISNEQELAFSGNENAGNADPNTEGKSRAEILRGAWSTPILVDVDQRQDLVVTLPRRILGLDPQTGQERWMSGGYSPLVYASPMAGDGSLLVLGGYFGASMALRTGGQGDITESHRLWHKPRDGLWLGTGVIHEGHAYLCDMGGIAHCLEVATGVEKWKKRLEGTGGQGTTWGSLTMTADGLVYVMNQTADTFVFRATPEKYEEVARNSLNEMTNSSVVIAGGDVILRTHDALWCVRRR